MIIFIIFFLKKSLILDTYASEFLQVDKYSKTHKKVLKGGPSSVYKLSRVLILFCMLRTIYKLVMRIGHLH